MCTAISYRNSSHYFGRTLDYERAYGEEVVFTPRQFPFPFRQLPMLERHHAILGMAHVEDGYPLYYDAMNEKGLCMAGLNFVGFAAYNGQGRDKVAPFVRPSKNSMVFESDFSVTIAFFHSDV